MRLLQIALFTILIGLSGCGQGTDFDYVDENEIRPGKGIISGEEGGFVLYRKEGNAKEDVESSEADSSAKESE